MAVLDVLGSPTVGAAAAGLSQGIDVAQQRQNQLTQQALMQAQLGLAAQQQGFQQDLQTKQERRRQELHPTQVRAQEITVEKGERQVETAPPEFGALLSSVVPGFQAPEGDFTRDELASAAGMQLRQHLSALAAQGRFREASMLVGGANAMRASIAQQMRELMDQRAKLAKAKDKMGISDEELKTIRIQEILVNNRLKDLQQQLDGLSQSIGTAIPELGGVTAPQTPQLNPADVRGAAKTDLQSATDRLSQEAEGGVFGGL